MKCRVLLFLWVLAAFSTSAFAEQASPGKAQADPAPAAEAGLPKKLVSEEMSVVWCQKMQECSQDKSMGLKECQKVLFKSFKTGFENLPKGQTVEVKREGFEVCKKNILEGTCDALKKAHVIPGCEFISVLNRPN